ncbi:IlvGEDA operon leader peptide [Proteus sp. G4412]
MINPLCGAALGRRKAN